MSNVKNSLTYLLTSSGINFNVVVMVVVAFNSNIWKAENWNGTSATTWQQHSLKPPAIEVFVYKLVESGRQLVVERPIAGRTTMLDLLTRMRIHWFNSLSFWRFDEGHFITSMLVMTMMMMISNIIIIIMIINLNSNFMVEVASSFSLLLFSCVSNRLNDQYPSPNQRE